MEESRALAKHTAERVEAVDQQLATVNDLAEQTSSHVGEIARALADESGSVATLATATQSVVQSITELRAEVHAISNEAFAVGNVVDEGFHQLSRVDIDSPFHRRLALCRELSTRSGDILTRAVASGRCTLDQALALEYREIVGAEVRGLARLFDVSKVPESGFTPPKYHTAYDKIVDVDMQRVCDDVLARDEKLLFALPIDLNSYGPIHNRRFMKDWTGDPAKDLGGNRIKRFFTDNRVLVRGARVGLGNAALGLPDRVTRAEFQRVAPLAATPAQREEFMVQTYVRDTGALVTVVTAPIFVQGHRWGAGLIGWTEES
jgi:methyl-accepting chemotaxis protein